VKLQSPLGNRFLFANGSQTVAHGHRRYSRLTLVTAGLFVKQGGSAGDLILTEEKMKIISYHKR